MDAPDTGLRDALNLLVNAVAHYLEEGRDLDAAIEASYACPPETVLAWIAPAAQ